MILLRFLRTQWDRAGAIGAGLAGALVLFLGYLGTRNAVLVEQQLPYVISGGLFGIFLLAIGGVLWLSADLRDDWRELREVKTALERLHDLEASRQSAEEQRERNGTTRRRAERGSVR